MGRADTCWAIRNSLGGVHEGIKRFYAALALCVDCRKHGGQRGRPGLVAEVVACRHCLCRVDGHRCRSYGHLRNVVFGRAKNSPANGEPGLALGRHCRLKGGFGLTIVLADLGLWAIIDFEGRSYQFLGTSYELRDKKPCPMRM